MEGPVVLWGERYRLIGLDLRRELQMEQSLSAAGLDRSAPTLLLSEVVLTYLKTKESDALIRWAADFLPRSVFVMYEQIGPTDAFGRIMQEHFKRRNSPLHALQQYPTKEAQRSRFLHRGWEECVCLDMNQFYFGLIPKDERARVESLEPFDEHEEWHQKCSHYCILTASRGEGMGAALISRTGQSFADVGTIVAPAVDPAVTPAVDPAVVLAVAPAVYPAVVLAVAPAVVPAVDPAVDPIVDPALAPSVVPAVALSVRLEGLGMSSAWLGAGFILLTGGSTRSGRGAETRLLLQEDGGWNCRPLQGSEEPGYRLYHSSTVLSDGSVLLFGGRSSPLRPVTHTLRLFVRQQNKEQQQQHQDQQLQQQPDQQQDQQQHCLSMELMICQGEAPQPRWRHTAVKVTYMGCDYLLVFGGKNATNAALGDLNFLNLDQQRWTQVCVSGPAPLARHSHSASSYKGAMVLLGGVGEDGAPLGDTVLLRPKQQQSQQGGFVWETVDVQPAPTPRYGHRSAVVNGKLLAVGGVWIQKEGAPGVLVINLETGTSSELLLHTVCVDFPLLLHSFCLESADACHSRLLLIGGGGNCFSFGTHLNPRVVAVETARALQ